jgi:hypothetical protein
MLLNNNIESLTITYSDDDLSAAGLPSNSAVGRNFGGIREVAISLTGKTSLPDPSYTHPTESDNYIRLTLSAEVAPRNLAY